MAEQHTQAISSEIDYDQAYRFKLWVTAVEDSATLGMGFRAYHSHILRSLYAWQEQGVIFTTPNGKKISFDTLTSDDLHGFLGKKNSEMVGPTRHIKNFKIAVIDAFLKYKFPKFRHFFRNSDRVIALRAMLLEFHKARQPRNFSIIKLVSFLEKSDALFISHPTIDQISAINRNFDAELFDYYLNCYHFSSRQNSGSINVTKLNIPIHPQMIKENTDVFSNLKNRNLQYNYFEGIRIFKGIGIPCEHENMDIFHSVISCLLRDNTFHSPYYANIGIIHQIIGGLEKVFFEIFENIDYKIAPNMILCDNIDDRYNSDKWIFREHFIKDVRSLINKIGSEI